MFGTRNGAHYRDMGAGGLVQVQADGGDDTGEHPQFHAQQQGETDGGYHRDEIRAGVLPGALDHAEIYQRSHCHDDGCGQGGLGQEEQYRGQQQSCQGDARCRDNAGGLGLRTGVEIDHRAGKSAGNGKAAGDPRGDVGGPQGQQFLVRVDALAPLGSQGLAHRNRLDKTDDGNQQCRYRQFGPQARLEGGQGKDGQPAGHRAHQGHPASGEVAQVAGQRGGDNHQHRPGLGQEAGGRVRQAQAQQQGFEALARPEQEHRGQCPGHQGDGIEIRQVGREALQQLGQGLAVAADAQNMPQLAQADNDARGGDKARHHRVGEEVGEKAEAQAAHEQQHAAGQHRHGDGRGGVADGAGGRHLAYRGRGHE